MGVERSGLYKRRAVLRSFGAILATTAFALGVPASAILEPSTQISGCLIDHRLVTRNFCQPAAESNLSNITSTQLPEISTLVTEPLKIVGQESQKPIIPAPTPSIEPQIAPAPKPAESPTPALQPQAKENKEVSFECSVLYYHEISPTQFKADLMGLIGKGYKPLSLDEYAAILKGEKNVPSYPTFLVTFDDGLKSQLKAIPVIEEIQKQTGVLVPLTIFSIMKFGGMDDKTIAQMINHKPLPGQPYWGDTPSFFDGDPKNGGHNYLSALELVTLAGKEWISVQPHTMDHANLTKLPEKEIRSQILPAEIRSDQINEAAGKKRTVRATAYPYGAYNTTVANFLASIGIYVVFTTEQKTLQNSLRREMLPRIRKSLFGNTYSSA